MQIGQKRLARNYFTDPLQIILIFSTYYIKKMLLFVSMKVQWWCGSHCATNAQNIEVVHFLLSSCARGTNELIEG